MRITATRSLTSTFSPGTRSCEYILISGTSVPQSRAVWSTSPMAESTHGSLGPIRAMRLVKRAVCAPLIAGTYRHFSAPLCQSTSRIRADLTSAKERLGLATVAMK